MVKVGIMICDRNRKCTGNKCFMSIRERDGAFAGYPEDEPIDVVGFIPCGGCPGERLEFSPADMKKYGAEVIHLASCFLAGYPACPYIGDFVNYIENYVGLPVVVGSHPMPQNYIDTHEEYGDWDRDGVRDYLKNIVGDREAALKYDSTQPDFLKKK
ncbi:CGGC domain-containing protein [Candidatus Bathyarchaeota archaeon]|nr:MAG: CGGC domain-containing protein [Candidatus Bathyarchaeota archaeon]